MDNGMTPVAIDVQSLGKIFETRHGFWRQKKKSVLAVEDISFSIVKGELFGLLGPNGAGKTTTVKMLTTILLPTAGDARILGFDLRKDTQEIRKRIGFTFGGARGLYGRLTARDNLRYFAELYTLEPSLSKKRVAEMLAMVGLSERSDDRVETFSSGMQQRLHMARALLHDPEVIFLDEPTVGIDPVGARELRQTIKNLRQAGKTIMLTTHYMAEAEELCDRIAIVNKGLIVAMDTPSNLRRGISPESIIEITVTPENTGEIRNLITSLDGKTRVETTTNLLENRFNIYTAEPEAILQALGPSLQSRSIQGLQVRNQTMEDVYVAIIQDTNRNE
jgi:ABC-2 type transport system ATP-binding protein